jgi:7,8-dihydropterin-6-yl-methyl-4-(beta-D-ribofuranosyl)aminobenzene 5'-phosphate synthase
MEGCELHRLDRRAFMGGVGACALGALAAPSVAERPLLTVPEVDRLAVQVVVDAATFGPFLPDQALPGLVVRRGGAVPAARISRRALMAEFGLSLLATSIRGAQTRRVMVDFGYSSQVLENNIELLGIDPAQLDAAVLSHGHLDHYGGVRGLFGRRAASAPGLPLIVGGEEIFCERVAAMGDPPPVMGSLNRGELASAGLRPRISPEPVVLADHAFTTGIIPLQSFERAAIPTRMRPGVGCDVRQLSPNKRNLANVPDDAEHELATCYAVKDLGLVVIASCSHRGVLNSIRRGQAISGVDRVLAVIGGFHLVRPRTEEEARRTVAEFAEIDPAYIVPMHCTGETFIAEAHRRMPEKILRPYVGNTFIFGAV